MRRRIVLLCDISGSMEPYARAYLQFLVCAAGAGPRAEAFVFATRLTRLTRALASRNPDRAIARAAAAAPDWSSGTRIGDALKEFNDRHGRRGMARGAVVVILSDGWERGDPGLVGPRDGAPAAPGLPDRVGQPTRRRAPASRLGWAGWLRRCPFCDALVSGHSLEALEEVADAIAAPRGMRDAPLADASRRRMTRPRTVGKRDAGPGKLGGDAQRLRAEPRPDHAGMGAGAVSRPDWMGR